MEKEINIGEVFEQDECIDTAGISKGHGTEGVITRLPRKTHRGLKKYFGVKRAGNNCAELIDSVLMKVLDENEYCDANISTFECAPFVTVTYTFNDCTFIDAPGRRGSIKNMISGAVQTDVALLMVSANKGGFETSIQKYISEVARMLTKTGFKLNVKYENMERMKMLMGGVYLLF